MSTCSIPVRGTIGGRMRTWTYTLTEHEPDKPWLVVSVRRGMTVELEDHADFFEWSQQQWSSDCYLVELEAYRP